MLLPFGLALEIINMVLWIFISCCQATFSLAWIVVWFMMSGLGFILQYTLIIMGHAVFEWLPMVVRFLYTAVLVTIQIAWQCVEAVFQILAGAWMFVYDINWRALAAPAFGLALKVMNIMLWIISFCYEATLNLVWNIAWLLISAFLFVLHYTSIISGYVVFEWLPMLFRLIYSVAALLLYDLPWRLAEVSVTVTEAILNFVWNIAWLMISALSFVLQYTLIISRYVVFEWLPMLFRLIYSVAALLLYDLPWKLVEIFATVISSAWNHTSSVPVASILHQHERSGVADPPLPAKVRLGTYTVREVSRINGNFFEHLSETYALLLTALLVGIITCVALLIWHSQQKRSGRERSELLRRQLQQANMDLSQERDKLLCVVCQDLNRELVLKPCNHYCLCHRCSKALRECPICKSNILKTEKIYHS